MIPTFKICLQDGRRVCRPSCWPEAISNHYVKSVAKIRIRAGYTKHTSRVLRHDLNKSHLIREIRLLKRCKTANLSRFSRQALEPDLRRDSDKNPGSRIFGILSFGISREMYFDKYANRKLNVKLRDRVKLGLHLLAESNAALILNSWRVYTAHAHRE